MNEFTWKQMAQTNGTQNQVLMVNIIISVYNKHEQITVVQIITGCASASTTRTSSFGKPCLKYAAVC